MNPHEWEQRYLENLHPLMWTSFPSLPLQFVSVCKDIPLFLLQISSLFLGALPASRFSERESNRVRIQKKSPQAPLRGRVHKRGGMG